MDFYDFLSAIFLIIAAAYLNAREAIFFLSQTSTGETPALFQWSAILMVS
jgi:hypothetical protein